MENENRWELVLWKVSRKNATTEVRIFKLTETRRSKKLEILHFVFLCFPLRTKFKRMFEELKTDINHIVDSGVTMCH